MWWKSCGSHGELGVKAGFQVQAEVQAESEAGVGVGASVGVGVRAGVCAVLTAGVEAIHEVAVGEARKIDYD